MFSIFGHLGAKKLDFGIHLAQLGSKIAPQIALMAPKAFKKVSGARFFKVLEPTYSRDICWTTSGDHFGGFGMDVDGL